MSVLQQPLVSIIAVCYNHERFVIESLNSVLAQTYSNYELILIDDRSRDSSVKLMEDWIRTNRVNCTFRPHTENTGLCRSLNEGLSIAKGKYVALLATDDVWLPHKLAHQVGIMEKLPEHFGVLHGGVSMIDEHGKVLEPVVEAPRPELGFDKMPQGDVFVPLLHGNFIFAITALVRRECYQAIGNYDENLFYEDYDVWLRIARRFHFAFDPAVVANYRVVSTSMTRTGRSKVDAAKERIFQKHLSDASLSPELRHAVELSYLSFQATRHFRERTPERHKAIWRAWRATRKGRFACMLAFCLAHLPYGSYERASARFERVIRPFRSCKRAASEAPVGAVPSLESTSR
jgi:GT2 family glycosyltransferase